MVLRCKFPHDIIAEICAVQSVNVTPVVRFRRRPHWPTRSRRKKPHQLMPRNTALGSFVYI